MCLTLANTSLWLVYLTLCASIWQDLAAYASFLYRATLIGQIKMTYSVVIVFTLLASLHGVHARATIVADMQEVFNTHYSTLYYAITTHAYTHEHDLTISSNRCTSAYISTSLSVLHVATDHAYVLCDQSIQMFSLLVHTHWLTVTRSNLHVCATCRSAPMV
jgi:hypothetical protein